MHSIERKGNSMQLLRQGDVLLVSVDDPVPVGAKPIKRQHGRIVLAEGEATGHAHTIAAPRVRLYDLPPVADLSVRLLVAETQAVLAHQEHAAIVVPAGTYRVVRQREYTPEEIRNVAD